MDFLTAADADLFDSPGASSTIERDGYGRPRILPPPGGWPDGIRPDHPRPYTRTSRFCEMLDDAIGLSIWRGRHVALAVAKRPDLSAIISAYHYGSPMLDTFIEEALERAKDDKITNHKDGSPHEKLLAANYGTAVHAWTDPDSPPTAPPDAIADDVAAIVAEHNRQGIVTLETDIFVVCDELMVAGSLDALLLMPDFSVRVEDTKTSQELHEIANTIQVAVYTHGERYDPVTGERSKLHPDLDFTKGILCHAPAKSASCELHDIDLVRGWWLAQLAANVRNARSAAGRRGLLTSRGTGSEPIKLELSNLDELRQAAVWALEHASDESLRALMPELARLAET